jgi:hypothetical protein
MDGVVSHKVYFALKSQSNHRCHRLRRSTRVLSCLATKSNEFPGGQDPENERAALDPHPKSRFEPLRLPAVFVDASTRWERGDGQHRITIDMRYGTQP